MKLGFTRSSAPPKERPWLALERPSEARPQVILPKKPCKHSTFPRHPGIIPRTGIPPMNMSFCVGLRKKRLLCLGNQVQMIFHDDKSKHGEPIFVLQKLQSVNDDLFGIRFGKNRQPINDGAG